MIKAVVFVTFALWSATLLGCGDDDPCKCCNGEKCGPDAGSDPGLRFVEGTPLTPRSPRDDADPDAEGFQVDLSVEPTAATADGYGKVTFTLDDVAQGEPVPFENDKASIRMTLNVGPKGTRTLNLIHASTTREGKSDADAAWVVTVRADE